MKPINGSRPRLTTLTPGELAPLLVHLPDPVLASLVELNEPAWRAALDQWGLCGAALLGASGTPRAAALVCPALHLPQHHPLHDFGRNPEAALLVALVASGASRDARLLVQHLSRGLVRKASALEACGGPDAGDCRRPSATWLGECGFHLVEQHRLLDSTRMRLDLRTTVRWPDLAPAWEAVRSLVPRPVPPVEPSSRELDASPAPR